MGGDVTNMDDPLYISRLLADGKPGVRTFDDFSPRLFRRVIYVQPHDLVARSHQDPHTAVSKPEDSLDHILLGFFEDTGNRCLPDQNADFFFGYRRSFTGLNLKRRSTKSIETLSTSIMGEVIAKSLAIGFATAAAIPSGAYTAILFGTSSARSDK